MHKVYFYNEKKGGHFHPKINLSTSLLPRILQNFQASEEFFSACSSIAEGCKHRIKKKLRRHRNFSLRYAQTTSKTGYFRPS